MTSEALRNVVSEPHELLARMGASLRADIAPAVEGPAKTQAFMASVVLQKLARQLELSLEHRQAERADRAALVGALRMLLTGSAASTVVGAAVDAVETSEGPEALSALIRTLYAERGVLGDEIGRAHV